MAELMDLVSLRPDFADRYPPRSRVGRAGAAASHARSRPNPTSSVRDEPVSALDVSVQAQVPYLLDDLQTRLGLTYVFISHDLPRAAVA
jgi:ABC-type oligopeptide transport system ATPase subunit